MGPDKEMSVGDLWAKSTENPSKQAFSVPLTNVDYDVKIHETTAKVQIVQKYFNKEEHLLESVYVFPIEDNAAVVGFNAVFDDGRIISSEVMEKSAAAIKYEEALIDKKSAINMEEIAPDILKANLGNLPPNSGCTITIDYVCEIPFDEEGIRLVIPSTIASKINPGDQKSKEKNNKRDHGAKEEVPPFRVIKHDVRKEILSKDKQTKTINLSNENNKKSNHGEVEEKYARPLLKSPLKSPKNQRKPSSSFYIDTPDSPSAPSAPEESKPEEKGSQQKINPQYMVKHDEQSPAPMTIKMEILTEAKLKHISSPSHEIESSINEEPNDDDFYECALKSSSTDMNRDFVVLIEKDKTNIEKSDMKEGQKTTMKTKLVLEKSASGTIAAKLSMIPKFKFRIQPSEVVFIVDCSDSMDGEDGGSIELAQEALEFLLQSLPAECYFNIVKFGTTFEYLYKKSQLYDEKTLKEARRYSSAKKMTPIMEGTDILGPLKFIFSQDPIPGYKRQVFLMTDGEVSNTEECIELVRRNAGKNRLFTLGIGPLASPHLLKGMAKAGNGTAIFATIGENLSTKVIKQLSDATMPCIEKVTVDWNGSPAEKSDIGLHNKQTPITVPPLFDGYHHIVYKLYDSEKEIPDKIIINSETPEGKLELKILVDRTGIVEGNLIHPMFVMKISQDLEELVEGKNEVIKAEIVNLGCKYNVLSSFTSFVGVDDKKNVTNKITVKRTIKSQIPSGKKIPKRRMSRTNSSDHEVPEAFSRRLKKIPSGTPSSSNRSSKASSVGSRSSFYCDTPDTSNRSSLASQISNDSNSSKRESHKSTRKDSILEDEELESAPLFNRRRKKMSIELIALQNPNGSFRRDILLGKLAGKSVDEIDMEAEKNGVDKDIWITAMALAIIETKYKDEKDSLALISEKAMEWISLSGEEEHKLLDKAIRFLGFIN